MSVKPVFAERILSGSKKVEFRKTRFRRAVSHVVIYATAPVKRVLGCFEVAAVDQGAPDELWARYAHVGGIDEWQFRAYYGHDAKGIAIQVGRVIQFSSPLELGVFGLEGPAPQSYRYLDPAVLPRVSCQAKEKKDRSGHRRARP